MGLLDDRKQKKKRARFVRNSFHHARLEDTWRRPRGIHSALRHKEKCSGIVVQVGYGSPKEVKCLHPCGLKDVLIKTRKDFTGLNPKEYALRFSSHLGKMKRTQLLEAADKLGFKILNR